MLCTGPTLTLLEREAPLAQHRTATSGPHGGPEAVLRALPPCCLFLCCLYRAFRGLLSPSAHCRGTPETTPRRAVVFLHL